MNDRVGKWRRGNNKYIQRHMKNTNFCNFKTNTPFTECTLNDLKILNTFYAEETINYKNLS